MKPPTEVSGVAAGRAGTPAQRAWRFPIGAQLLAIVSAFVVGFVLFVLLIVVSFRIATGIRAYVGGEGLWSKGQKDAVYYLERYARTHDPEDFSKYQAGVAITLGDRLAREELQKPEFDPEVVERGFVQGLNAAEDVPALIFLFRWFHSIGPMERAIEVWTQGDEGIEELEAAAAELHAVVTRGGMDAATERAFIDRIESINDRLTPLEREFSETLSHAARQVRDVLFVAVLVTAVLMLGGGLLVSWHISRGLNRGLRALADGVARVERGDLDEEIDLRSHDELGDLAQAFNEMVVHRREAERELRHRADELGRSNAELEQFAYVASHDLQEPLRTVASYAQLLVRRAEGQLGPDADEYVQHINDAVVRMRSLIEDLLSYSRVARRSLEPKRSVLDELLQEALSNLAGAIQAEKARVTHDPLPTVTVIPHLVVQLFQNLIGNAIKFRGSDAPQVHVTSRRRGADWEFSVRDNGIGIEPEHAERIFVLFQRLHPRDRYPGSGLGLAICKKIVEQQGGRIWVEKSVAGADIRFTLPADEPA